jgi:two-component system response regulator
MVKDMAHENDASSRALAREAETIRAHRGPSQSPTLQTGSYVLIVDDNECDLLLQSRMLKRAGVALPIVTARDGLEALDLIHLNRAAGRGLPRLVLADLRLPRQSGLELVQLLRAGLSTRDIPVIVLTGCSCGAAAFPVRDFQLAGFLSKPVTIATFQGAVRELDLADVLESSERRPHESAA